MSLTATSVREQADNILPQLREIRQYLHTHPELSFKEFKTAAYLADFFRKENFQVQEQVAGTGLIITLEGQLPGPTVALRADMDALPIHERSTVSYRSRHEGVMHACGHDVHMTCLLGALLILRDNKQHLAGKVIAIFQPGEEVLPGGASLVLASGALNPLPEKIIGQHVYPELSAGKVGFRKGAYMASTDELRFKVKGKGGHGALPHRNVDPVVTACRIVTALQEISSRFAPPSIPTVLSIGKMIADGATNIIPDEVSMEGTFRTMDEPWREKAHQLIRQVCENTAKSAGCTCEVEITKGYPVLFNNEEFTSACIQKATDFLGKEQVEMLDVRMTAEDFAWYSQVMPGCFYRLGTASQDGRFTDSVHTPGFDIDESALATGAGLMAWLILSK